MRRTPLPLLLLLSAALLAPGAAVAQEPTPSPGAAVAREPTPAPRSAPEPTPAAAVAREPTPAPGPLPAVTVTLADDGRTVTLSPGQQLQVRLDGPADAVWEGVETGGPTLHLLRYSSTQADGLSAALEALSPGRYGGSSEVRPQALTAQTSPRCRASGTRCGLPSRVWSLDVVVADGPSAPRDTPCATIGRATPSPAPGTVVVTARDDGRTVQVGRGGLVQVYLDDCGDPRPAPVRAGRPLYRESVHLDRTSGGFLDATFRPLAAGTTTITAPYDARCLHRTDDAGDGECVLPARVFSVTVEVLAGATAPPCTRPVTQGFTVSPQRVSAGDPVVVEGGRDDLCVEESQEPERHFSLQARTEGGTAYREVHALRARSFRYAGARPLTTTTYRLLMDGQPLRQQDPEDTVVVDRTSGSCATGLTLTGPAWVAAQSTVTLTGRATPGGTVEVLFRRRDTTAFVVRRTVTAGPDGGFSTTWVATDDHRWSARTARCDTVPGLTRVRPVVIGPAVVPRGSTVTLRVTAATGVRTLVFLRGAGEAFQPRRALTGSGTVRYVATNDQRWFALTRDVAGTPGLTQAR